MTPGIFKLNGHINCWKYEPFFFNQKTYNNWDEYHFGTTTNLNVGKSKIENNDCLIHFHTYALNLLVTLPKKKIEMKSI